MKPFFSNHDSPNIYLFITFEINMKYYKIEIFDSQYMQHLLWPLYTQAHARTLLPSFTRHSLERRLAKSLKTAGVRCLGHMFWISSLLLCYYEYPDWLGCFKVFDRVWFCLGASFACLLDYFRVLLCHCVTMNILIAYLPRNWNLISKWLFACFIQDEVIGYLYW